MATNNPQLPLSYRAELLKSVLANVRMGECCSLIGMEGVGKSNLGRFLQRHDVQLTYWKDDASWIILIDSHSLILHEENPEYHFIRSMMQGLISEAKRRSFSSDFLVAATDLYERFTENSNALLAFQQLCQRLCTQHGIQLIFVFDQFEDIWQTLNARFFLNLRYLRDQFKYQLVYLVMSSDRLQSIRPDSHTVESFWELFSLHTYGLGPYSEEDAAVMVERLALRAGIAATAIPPEVTTLSGRHPGLIRAIFWAARNASVQSLTIDALLEISSLCEECAKIWRSFSPEEQNVIRLLAQNAPLQPSTLTIVDNLRLKKAIFGTPPILFSPLFAAYVQRKCSNTQPGVIVDVSLRQVWLDGQLLQQSLPPLEFKLLAHLARHSGTVCKREDLVRALYNEDYYDRSDQRIYAVLSRLREALKEDSQAPRYLITHRGGGIQLTQGTVINDEGA